MEKDFGSKEVEKGKVGDIKEKKLALASSSKSKKYGLYSMVLGIPIAFFLWFSFIYSLEGEARHVHPYSIFSSLILWEVSGVGIFYLLGGGIYKYINFEECIVIPYIGKTFIIKKNTYNTEVLEDV